MTSKFLGVLLTVTFVTASALAGAASVPGFDEYAALERLAAANNPLILNFKETPLARLLAAIGGSAGLQFDLSALPEPAMTVSIATTGRLKDVLAQLARDYQLAYEVIGPDKLVVRSEIGLAPLPTPDEYEALDHLTATSLPVVLRFSEVTLAQVLDGMGRASGVDIDFEGLPEMRVSLDTGQVSLKEALIRLAREHKLVYEVVGTDKLVVRMKGKALG